MTLLARCRARGAAVLAFALAAAVPVAAAPAASAASAGGQAAPVRVLSYNAFLFSKSLYPNWGQDHRAAEIAKAPFMSGNDVVVFQELFDNSSSDALKRAVADRYPYQTPVVGRTKSGWDATGGSYSSTTRRTAESSSPAGGRSCAASSGSTGTPAAPTGGPTRASRTSCST